MKDQELFDLIKKVVRQKKTISHHSETMDFAQRYCKQQLLRKKLNPHRYGEKMNHLMKDFQKLDTYVDLPDLLHSIKVMRMKEFVGKENKAVAESYGSAGKQCSITTEKNMHFNKYFNDIKKLKYITEDERFKQILTQMGIQSGKTSKNMSNNSPYNLTNLFSNLEDQIDDDINKGSKKLFQMLNKYEGGNQSIVPNNQSSEYRVSKLNSEEKKKESIFLHKVCSYLQIILQTEHRAKWGVKKQKNEHANHIQSIILKGQLEYKPKQYKPIQFKIKQKPPIKSLNNKNSPPNQLQDQILKSSLFLSNHSSLHSRVGQLTDRTIQGQQFQMRQTIKDVFTFRRRSVKQKIISQITKFIREIDEQVHCNRQENKYYHKEINKLEANSIKLYGRYRRETLAGDKDIQNLKKMASTFQIYSSPSKQVSKLVVANQQSDWSSSDEENDSFG